MTRAQVTSHAQPTEAPKRPRDTFLIVPFATIALGAASLFFFFFLRQLNTQALGHWLYFLLWFYGNRASVSGPLLA